MSFETRRGALVAAVALVSALGLLPAAARAETVFITGANSGIGLEFAKQYAAKGWTVIATHRRSQTPKTLAELSAKYSKVRIERLDVTSPDEANALAARMKDVSIDVLINNAGVYNDRAKCAAEDEACPGDWSTQTFGKFNYPLLDTIMAVNIKGPLVVTEAFYSNVKASALKKIVAISSSNGTLTGENPPRAGTIYYRDRKSVV